MAQHETGVGQAGAEPAPKAPSEAKDTRVAWLDLLKVVAIPLVTLILGFVFNASLNSRQERDNNIRLYTEMMGRREDSDSALRKDMFNSIMSTFMGKNANLKPDDQLNLEVLNLELLAYNFHEALDLAPLFKHVRTRIPPDPGGREGRYAAMTRRLERVAEEVSFRQLSVLSDSGMVEKGDVPLADGGKNETSFGAHAVGDSRVCLSMDSSDERKHYRQFKLEITDSDSATREVRVRLQVSKVLDEQVCEKADLNLLANREIDTTFHVGPFDFPMIDNTHLTHGERCAVSMLQMTDSWVKLALTYFPGSRASLKDKPYFDDVIHDLLQRPHVPGHDER